MSAQPSRQSSSDPTDARADYQAQQIRRNHQQLQHFINRMLNRLEVPDKAARAVAGIHGMLNGRSRMPVFAAHMFTARQLNFKGKDENADVYMCRVLTALDEAERKCGRRFFRITRADGVTQKVTSYDADYIGEAALWGLLEAQNSPTWKQHPARAVDEFVDAAIARLPERETEGDDERAARLSASEYQFQQERRLLDSIEKVADELESRGGDADLWLEKLESKLARIRRSRARTAPARLSYIMLHDDDEDAVEESLLGEPPASEVPVAEAESVRFSPGQFDGVNQEIPQQNDQLPKTDLSAAAIAWAGQGVAVFPLYGVSDGVCDCRDGSECRSAGKHPLARLAPRGVKDATTDAEQIARWWSAAPLANLGIAMGGPLRLLAVDVDPRAGGDASLCDLVEAHGMDWLDTFTVRTGGNGMHFLFRLPEGVEARRGKLAPGIDLKSEGGYLVAAPSIHASGRRYEVEKNTYAAEAPDWLVEQLMRAPGQTLAHVVNFQERRTARAQGGPSITGGERNDRLFKIGCAIWGGGSASDVADLHAQLSEVNLERCVPPLSGAEVAKMAAHIAADYPRGTSTYNNNGR